MSTEIFLMSALLFIIMILVVVIVVLEKLHYKERKELTKIIIAKDTREYIQITNAEKDNPNSRKPIDPARREYEELRNMGYVK